MHYRMTRMTRINCNCHRRARGDAEELRGAENRN
jgi:hypothetical protein